MSRLPTKILVFALALAALGAGSATAAKLITGKSVKNRSLTGKDIRKGSLNAAVLAPGVRAQLGGGAAGAPGPKGDAGARGDQGPTGPAGPVDVAIHHVDEALVTSPETRVVAAQALEAGTYAVTAALSMVVNEPGKTQGCSLLQGDKVLHSSTAAVNDGTRLEITLTGAAELPADGSVRVSCTPEGDSASISNLSIVSTRATSATTTTP